MAGGTLRPVECRAYVSSRELHQDFARFMQGRGFVPSEQVFVARFEGVNGLWYSRKLPNGKHIFWGIALGRHPSELPLNRGSSGLQELDPKD
jgi:hypothetical protein